MRIIPNKVLPDDWNDKVRACTIDGLSLSENSKLIAKKLHSIVVRDGEQCLTDPLVAKFVELCVSGKIAEFLSGHDAIPIEAIRNTLEELHGEKGFDLSRKLHSLFVELLVFKYLSCQGYVLKEASIRSDGDCDFVATKDGAEFNFEVKFKESADVMVSRMFDYLQGYSLLRKNSFLRDKCLSIAVKTAITDKNKGQLVEDLDRFISSAPLPFDGELLTITECDVVESGRDYTDVVEKLESLKVSELDVERAAELVAKFTESGNQIDKLKTKAARFTPDQNFTGCFAWSVPFILDTKDLEAIQSVFEGLRLDFDMYVFIHSYHSVALNPILIPKLVTT